MGGSESWKEKKYYIASDLFPNSPEWIEWGRVAGEQPAPYWSSFFVGSWNLGEGMGINSSVAGNTETTEFADRSATENLNLNGDGGFRWVTVDGQTRTGRWTPATDGPGVVLASGADGATWILRNETNAIEENIRGIQSARLTTEGKMSIVATRPAR
jgi:hypothetical protein